MDKGAFWVIIAIIGIEVIFWHLLIPAIIVNNSIAATALLTIVSCIGVWIRYEIYTEI